MSSFTKKAILESFLRLAEKKTIDKITVRDIVDDCGVNRNTFYYHFQDIYAVLETLCQHAVKRLPVQAPLAETLAAFLDTVTAFAIKFPHATKSLSLSLGFEGLVRYFGADLDAVITERALQHYGQAPAPIEIAMLRFAVLGLCFDTLQNGKRPPHTPQQLELALNRLANIKPDKN